MVAWRDGPLNAGEPKPLKAKRNIPVLQSPRQRDFMTEREGVREQSPFVGRRRELGSIFQSLRDVKSGHGHSWIVSGTAGIGKTRLLMELGTLAKREGFDVTWAHGLRISPEPMLVWEEAFRNLGVGHDKAPGTLENTILSPATGSQTRRGKGKRRHSHEILLLRYLDRLEQLTKERDTLIILDDLQWVGAVSWSAFQFIARNLKGLRILLVASYRDDEEVDSEGEEIHLPDIIDALERSGDLSRLSLSPLNAEESLKLAEGLLGPTALPSRTRNWVDTAVKRSAGNPYFLMELLRYGMQKGPDRLMFVEGDSMRGQGGIPPTLRRLLSRRIDSLPKEERRVLEAGALIGMEFELAPLVAGIGDAAARIRATLQALEREVILRSTSGDSERCSFCHPLMYEVVRETTGVEARESIAARLAPWWAKERPDQVHTIARLYYESGERSPALKWLGQALASAVESRALEMVMVYDRWIAEMLEGSPDQFGPYIEEELRIVHELSRFGPKSVVRRYIERLMERPLPPPQRLQVRIALADSLVYRDIVAAEKIIGELESELTDKTEPMIRASVAVLSLKVPMYHRDWQNLASRASGAADLMEKAKDWEDLMETLCRCGFALAMLGHLNEADQVLARARRLLSYPSARTKEHLLLQGESIVAEQQGDLSRAEKLHRRSLEVIRREGMILSLPVALTNLSINLQAQGRYIEAEPFIRQILAIAEKFDISIVVFMALVLRAYGQYASGQWEKALRDLDLSIAEVKSSAYDPNPSEALILRTQVLGELGDPKRGWEELQDVYKKLPPATLEVQATLIHHTRSRILELLGRISEAEKEYELTKESFGQMSFPRPVILGESLMGLYRCAVARGDNKSAERLRKEAEAVVKRTGVPLTPWFRDISFGLREGAKASKGDVRRRHVPAVTDSIGKARMPPAPNQAVSERILIHLLRLGQWDKTGVAPAGSTQGGISQVLGRPQGAFAKTLLRMEEGGLLTKELGHVVGVSRRLKVYRLTPLGLAKTADLIRRQGASPRTN